MRRGDIILLDLDSPPGGSGREQTGTRPVAVVSLGSDDPNNPMITVVPCTGQMEKQRYPHTLVVQPSLQNGLTTESVLMAFQVVSYDKRRIVKIIGRLEQPLMERLEQLLRDLMHL
jgi:mRNA-degrading endonuclease toxin of MazEF toxin-antitoxin module